MTVLAVRVLVLSILHADVVTTGSQKFHNSSVTLKCLSNITKIHSN